MITHSHNCRTLPACSQAPLIGLYNKYKDSKGKQAKLKSPGQLQELLDVVRALLADMEAKSSSQRCVDRYTLQRDGQLVSACVIICVHCCFAAGTV